ncbi:ribonuclease H-like domain-containing protein [Tanacetum coccineum]
MDTGFMDPLIFTQMDCMGDPLSWSRLRRTQRLIAPSKEVCHKGTWCGVVCLPCNPCCTPVDTDSKLAAIGDPISDPTLYRRLAGALQYLTFTWPDISYAVQQLYSSSSSSLVVIQMWNGWLSHYTTLYFIAIMLFLGKIFYLGISKRQFTLLESSAEAEYRVLPMAVARTFLVAQSFS